MMRNPFKNHKLRHYEIVYQDVLERNSKKVLDFGTGTSEFISKLNIICKDLYAFDVDKENVVNAKTKYPYLKVKYVKVGTKIPYKNASFDAIFMFHVLEHVDDENAAIKEAYRLLKKNGVLYLASPYKGFFTWADTANLRYRFPRFHKIFMDLVLGKDEYKKRFNNKADQNLFGDCSANVTWHKHYKKSEIIDKTKRYFLIESFYRFSLFHPFLLVADNIWNYFSKKNNFLTKGLLALDNRIDAGEYSYNFLAILRKR